MIGFDRIKNDGALHAVLGYMPQKFGLYEDLTVMENLNLYADLRSVTGEARKQTFARLLEFTSLGPFTGRLAAAFRWDETKTRPGLYPGGRTESVAAR